MRGALPDPAEMSPAALAGQLVCVALRDYAGDGSERMAFLESVARHGWGGVIVFGGELAAVRDLVAEADARSDVPLLVTGDFERGLGQQFPRGGTSFPPLMALGSAGDPALARAAALAAARELRSAGFHVDFAPVADLACEPANPIVSTRAAGDHPERVAEIVAASVAGLQEGGVAATVKHFPGHRRTTVDSHAVLPVVEATREELEATDWVPFRAGLDAGARLVMTAHVAFPALEPDGARDRPATFSPAVSTGILRDEWDFEGLLCSDALMMGAVAGEAPEAVAIRALAAGVDWLLYPPDPARVRIGLARALERGTLDRGRCERAVERLTVLKLAVGAGQPAPGWPATSAAPVAEAVAAAALAAEPPRPPAGAAWPDRAQWVVVLDGAIVAGDVVVGRELGPRAAERLVVVDAAADEAAARAALAQAMARAERAWVACAVFNPVRAWKGRAGLSPLAREAVNAVCGAAREAVLIVHGDPRIVEAVRPPVRIVWAYGEDPASQRAVVAFLRGALPAAGRPPIALGS